MQIGIIQREASGPPLCLILKLYGKNLSLDYKQQLLETELSSWFFLSYHLTQVIRLWRRVFLSLQVITSSVPSQWVDYSTVAKAQTIRKHVRGARVKGRKQSWPTVSGLRKFPSCIFSLFFQRGPSFSCNRRNFGDDISPPMSNPKESDLLKAFQLITGKAETPQSPDFQLHAS